MGRFVWGISFIVILLGVSFLTYALPCKSNFPFLNVCVSKLIFAILNVVGMFVVSLFNSGVVYKTELNSLYLLSILINIPVYFLIGVVIRWLVKR